jgi:hypothetical protein
MALPLAYMCAIAIAIAIPIAIANAYASPSTMGQVLEILYIAMPKNSKIKRIAMTKITIDTLSCLDFITQPPYISQPSRP